MACAFIGGSGGALAIFSNLIFLSSPGTIQVETDAINQQLTVAPISTLSSAPIGMGIEGVLQLSPSMVSGVNAGTGFGGSDASGKTATLPNIGVSTMSLGVQGTLDKTARGGSYDVTAVITCI